MPSVVIAAHNEEQVINATLDALLEQQGQAPLEIIVIANGCSDQTASVARRPGVVVVDRPEPGKGAALNAGDEIATTFPRIYLDADIVVPRDGVTKILERLEHDSRVLAVVPSRRVDKAGRPSIVRAYSAIYERLPVFRNGLFGRGMIALSEEGRARFGAFPLMIADDLFLDSLFSEAEKVETRDVVVTIEAPYTTRDLFRRLVRVRRGNAEMRAASVAGEIDVSVRHSDRWAWMRDVVRHEPWLAPATVPYLVLTFGAAVMARRHPKAGHAWGRDESTRTGTLTGRPQTS
ncbi:glycosyltransferase [Microlunatus sp. Gsoil 973]|uniref:glycosyltransferase n=1 Tax=Microlunatus sp. Gsoil 973 TaxID=2672569 RepID=UPI0012B495C9|nr:glycosyltransferase [Microlunatus sp. Gsoil 973]QGN33884.1 glycosyltransferase [Microlunatus sp. Gsoil 973]